jgi:hypothetical protein
VENKLTVKISAEQALKLMIDDDLERVTVNISAEKAIEKARKTMRVFNIDGAGGNILRTMYECLEGGYDIEVGSPIHYELCEYFRHEVYK